MGSYTDTYRIPKVRIPVRMLLRNRTVHRCEVFVTVPREQRPPGQMLRELLEQERPFFPGLDLDDGSFSLVHRDSVVWCSTKKDPHRELDHLELFDNRVQVRLELATGTTLFGEVYYSAPSARSRLMDHLNGPERFFILHDDDRLVLVNKRDVDAVTEQRPARPSRPVSPPDPEENRGQD